MCMVLIYVKYCGNPRLRLIYSGWPIKSFNTLQFKIILAHLTLKISRFGFGEKNEVRVRQGSGSAKNKVRVRVRVRVRQNLKFGTTLGEANVIDAISSAGIQNGLSH